MAKIAAQAASIPMKAVQGSAKIHQNEQTQQMKSAGFSVALKNILAQKPEANGKVPVDIAELLVQLLSDVKQLLDSKKGSDKAIVTPEKAAQIINLLNDVIKHLRHPKEGLSDSVSKPKKSARIEHDLKELVWAVGQFDKLLNSTKEVNKEQQGQVDVRHLANRLLETVENLLQIRHPEERITALQQMSHPKNSIESSQNEFASLNRDVKKQIGPSKSENEDRESITENRRPQTVGPMRTTSSKDIAISAFRRLALIHGQNGGTGHLTSFDPGPMSRLQQFVIHVRGNGGGINQQQFIRDFQQILAQSTLTGGGGKEQLTVKLYPQHLGTLNIQLTRENGQVTATLIASTAAAKNLIETHLHQLQGAFASQNLLVDKLQVLLPSGQASAQQTYDHGEPHGQAQHGKRKEQEQQAKEGDGGDTSFTEWLQQLHLI